MFNIDDINDSISSFLDTFFTNINTEQGVSIDKEVKEPHIRFARQDLVNMITLASPILNPKSSQVVPKSIVIVYREDSYRMIANNDLEYLEYQFDVLNTENRLCDTLALPLDLVKSFANMLAEEIIIYKSGDGYFIRLLLEGDLYLELPSPEESLVERPFEDTEPFTYKSNSGEDKNLVSVSHLSEALKALIPILSEEPILEKRRITFTKDRAYFISNKYFMEYRLPLPSMRIGLRVATILRKICLFCNNEGGMYFFKDTKYQSRIVVKVKNIVFSSTVTSTTNESELLAYLDRMRNHKQVLVSIKDLARVVSVANDLPYSKKEVKIKLGEDMGIYIPMKTRVTNFRLPVKVIDTGTKKEVPISAEKLANLLASFSNGEAILSITDKLLIISKDNLLGAVTI